jgi:hypothetical protein
VRSPQALWTCKLSATVACTLHRGPAVMLQVVGSTPKLVALRVPCCTQTPVVVPHLLVPAPHRQLQLGSREGTHRRPGHRRPEWAVAPHDPWGRRQIPLRTQRQMAAGVLSCGGAPPWTVAAPPHRQSGFQQPAQKDLRRGQELAQGRPRGLGPGHPPRARQPRRLVHPRPVCKTQIVRYDGSQRTAREQAHVKAPPSLEHV